MLPEVGGARGEIARGMCVDRLSWAPGLSNRWETGATTSSRAWAAIAELVALQTGQKCEAAGAAVRSAQKWNCAPRKMTANSSAKTAVREVLWCMFLIRWSLGKNGCEVKQSVWAPRVPIRQPLAASVRPRWYSKVC